MIDLKRSQKKGDSKAKGIAIHLGPESDYPPEAGFSVSGDHSKKLFSDGLPAPKSRVKFRGEGHIANADEDGRVRVQMRKVHVEPHEDAEDDEEEPEPKGKSVRNAIKRSARQVGEDLGDEEE
jgi:hypothetical protein